MKRLPLFLVLLVGGLLLAGADGCSGDPNVEGAKLDLRNNDYDRALENVNTAIENNPQNAEAYKLKGDILQQQAMETQDVQQHTTLILGMIEAYDQAAELDPEWQDEVEQAKLFAYAKEFQRGGQAFEQGAENAEAYRDAANYFNSAAVIFPDSAGAYLNQAYALLNSGDQTEAIEPFRKAIERGEDAPDTYRYLGELYLINSEPEAAVALLEEAAEKYPENEDVQARLLNAYIQADMMDRAMDEYSAAVERNPDNPTYRYNYGSLLLEAEKYDEAIEQLSRATELDPDYGDAQYNLGASYVNKAVIVSERARELDDRLRQERAELSAEERQALDQQISDLIEERRGLFEQAIPPLEKAREVAEAAGETPTGICQALYQAYVQTGQEENAEGAAACAGYEDQ